MDDLNACMLLVSSLATVITQYINYICFSIYLFLFNVCSHGIKAETCVIQNT